MDITVFPVTRSSTDIKDNFLKQLSQWVDIRVKDYNMSKENPIKEDVRILIFKPTGRPKEEFDHLIEVFKDTGRRVVDFKILITATKPDRVKFEVPEKYNFAHQSCVYLDDENEIDPRSSEAIKQIADFLIHSCGFQPYSHETSMLDVVPGTTEPKSKVEDSRKGGNKTPTHDDLKRKLEEQEREIQELQQENKRLKACVEEKREENNDPQKETKRHKRTESRGACSAPAIRFKVKRASLPFCGCFCGYKEVSYDVSLYAVEDEIMDIEEGRYNFQRRYEKKYHLEPGTLRKVLEFIRDELKCLPSDVPIVEGPNFENLKRQVNEKFGLPGDRLKNLLKHIFKRKDKGKKWATPTSDENMAIRTQVEAYQACGDT